MPKTVFILVLIFSGFFAAWTFASPPTGTIGQTLGALFSNSSGDIGIRTSSPVTLLDVNGIVTIRKSLDMTNNRIINVAAPISAADGVNKAYVDAQAANMATTTAIGLWGQGRPGATVVNALGECTSTINAAIAKISRSGNTATWDGARAACPANWWVCSAAERGTIACGSSNKPILFCDPANSSNNELYHLTGLGVELTGNWAWVSDTATTNDRMAKAASIANGANTSEKYACNIAPVWCCSY